MDSAAATMLDLGDDMVTEILLRLPLESIFRYRSVSKQWNSLLTSLEFLSHYSRRFHHRQRTLGSPPNLLGFFLLPEFTLGEPRMPFLSSRGPLFGRDNLSSNLGDFITSSNGLVLCGVYTDPRPYHILNPMTRKHVSLPPPRRAYPNRLSIGLSCDEDGDGLTPRYEVVIADIPCLEPDNMVCIETYSSETKEWRESVLVATSVFRLVPTSYFRRLRYYSPTVLNGVFYWWAFPDFVAVYDPHNKQGGNKAPNHLQLIQLPAYRFKHILNQTPDGGLIFGQTSNGLIKIWELSARKLGFWRETTITKQEWVQIYEVPCEIGLELMEVITWNPLIVMVRQGSSVFEYNMETKVMKHIVLLPEKASLDQPFFEAISFSSYLLA